MPPYPPPDPTVRLAGSGPPIWIRLTPGAQPASSREDIQLSSLPGPAPPGPAPRPLRGHEWPTWGVPSEPTLLVQSWHVLLQFSPNRRPTESLPVRMSWLSTSLPSGAWLGTPSSLGRSLMITGSAPIGRG